MADISKIDPGNGTIYTIKDASAVSNISVSGTDLIVINRNNIAHNVKLPLDKKQSITASNDKVFLTGSSARMSD